MDAHRFRSRALHEGERYGADPYVFLRELAQNSRDAGARRIEVSAYVEDGKTCVLTFDDNGVGMSFEEARTFLFRLYASSKERTSGSAGRFGVGFWSILRFGPASLEIESRKGEEAWAVRCSGDLSRIDPIEPSKSGSGTCITLRRPLLATDRDFVECVGARLVHYCKYLRRSDGRRQPLPVNFNGRSLQEPMVLDGPLTLSFSSREAEGVVGLGDEPRVELYARGLWVTTVSVLEELDPETNVRRPESPGEGLAPVVIINSDALEVVLSRDKPVDSRALRRILRLAHARVDKLVEHAIDGVAPRSLLTRMGDRLRGTVRLLGGPAMASVLAAWAFVFLAGVASMAYLSQGGGLPFRRAAEVQATAGSPRLGRPYRGISGYRGATIDVPKATGEDLSLTVDSKSILYFRALSLETYDPRSGWQERKEPARTLHPAFRCEHGCVNVSMAVNPSPTPITIPVPTGYRLEPESLRWRGLPIDQVFIDESGVASLTLNGELMDLLTYRVGPTVSAKPRDALLPVGAPLNEAWRNVVRDHQRYRQRDRRGIDRTPANRGPKNRRRWLTDDEIAKSMTGIVRENLRYDVSQVTAQRFRDQPGLWSERVVAVGAGDCDVKNGLNVLLLRHLKIPARLAVGVVTVNGRARGGLHAWTEYYVDGRWWVADATGRPGDEPAPLAPSVSGPALDSLEPRSVSGVSEPSRRRRRPRRVGRAGPLPVSGSGARSPSVPSQPPPLEPTPPSSAEMGVDPGDEYEAAKPAPQSIATRDVPYWPIGVLLAAVAAGLILRTRNRRRVVETLERRGEGLDQRAAVAGMVRELLRGSASWRETPALAHRRLLPTLNGPPLSLVDAMERSRRGRLLGGRRKSLLARSATAGGHPVIDIDDPHFGPLVVQTFDFFDLSMLEGLSVARLPSALDQALTPLMEKHAHTTCVCSRRLGERSMIEYDLTQLRRKHMLDLPRRAVVVNLEHPEVRASIDVYERDPARAVYVLVDWIASRSMSCEPYASKLRQAAAKLVFSADSA